MPNSQTGLQLLTIEEAAAYLKVSKTSLRRWTNDGRLPCHRVGVRRERRFAISDLDQYIESPSYDVSECTVPLVPLVSKVSNDCAQVDLGDFSHVCSHFSTSDEWWDSFRPYLRRHIEADTPVIYIYDKTTPRELIDRITAEGYDTAHLMERGMLRLIPATEGYLRTGPHPGSFSAAGAIAYIESLILDQRSRNYPIFLLSGEMGWSLSGAPGVEECSRYEELLNGLFAKYPGVSGVCHYDTRLFNARQTLAAICQHTMVQMPGRIARGFFQPPASLTA